MKKINKKVMYAIRMYEFHSRLLSKWLGIIENYFKENNLIVSKNKNIGYVIEGQMSMFGEGAYETRERD